MDIEVSPNSSIGCNKCTDANTSKDCPIATPIINESYGPMREDIIK